MKPETESRRITRLHREWLAKRGLPAGNKFNHWEGSSAASDKPGTPFKFAAEVPLERDARTVERGNTVADIRVRAPGWRGWMYR